MVFFKKNSKQTTEAVSKENEDMAKSKVAKDLKDLELGLQEDKKSENVKQKQACIPLFAAALCAALFVAITLVCCAGEAKQAYAGLGQGQEPPATPAIQNGAVKPNPGGDYWADLYKYGKAALEALASGSAAVGPEAQQHHGGSGHAEGQVTTKGSKTGNAVSKVDATVSNSDWMAGNSCRVLSGNRVTICKGGCCNTLYEHEDSSEDRRQRGNTQAEEPVDPFPEQHNSPNVSNRPNQKSPIRYE